MLFSSSINALISITVTRILLPILVFIFMNKIKSRISGHPNHHSYSVGRQGAAVKSLFQVSAILISVICGIICMLSLNSLPLKIVLTLDIIVINHANRKTRVVKIWMFISMIKIKMKPFTILLAGKRHLLSVFAKNEGEKTQFVSIG